MNELVKIQLNESQEPFVDGRDLYEALEVKTAYKDWFPRMCEYGFEEGKDFCSILSKSTGGRPGTDHLLKLDMAKEIAMLQRSKKGKEIRQYFIQIEKEFNSPEKVMARALRIAEKELSSLRLEVKEMRPKALFADAVSTSDTSILIGDFAKILRQNDNV